jgi:RHS repeat-associated protein
MFGSVLRRRVALLVGVALLASSSAVGVLDATPAHAADIPGLTELGGLDLDGYCSSLGYFDAVVDGSIVAPDAAYDWYCNKQVTGQVPINLESACVAQYGPSLAFVDDPNNAFTWNCYSTNPGVPAISPTLNDGGPGANDNITNSPAPCSAGDPVVCPTGDFTQAITDLSVSGRGRSLAFTRTYNSDRAADTGRIGNGWSDSYAESVVVDGSGNAVVSLGTGAEIAFTPDGSGNWVPPTSITASLAGAVGTGWTFTYQNLSVDRFDANGRLVSLSDRDGETTTLTYNGAGDLATVTDAAGRSLQIAYTAQHQIASVTDPAGRVVRYSYSAAGDLVALTDVMGATTDYSYNAGHDLVTATDPLHRVTANTYNGSDQVVSQTDPTGAVTNLAYTGADGNGTTTITDPDGAVTVETFDGYLLSSVESLGDGNPTWSYTYDLNGNRVSSTDPLGDVTSAIYDAHNDLRNWTDALGRTGTVTYLAPGFPSSITDPAGVNTTYAYDAHTDVASMSTATSPTTAATETFGHADTAHPGDVTSVTDPDGHVTTYVYDAAGDQTSTVDALGDTTAITFDAVGRPTSSTDALHHTTHYVTDALGRVTALTDPMGHVSRATYDAAGQLISTTDPTGATSHAVYDTDGRPLTVTDPKGATATRTYDPAGDLIKTTDGAGRITSSTYTVLHQLASTTDPTGHTTTFAYDLAGRPTLTTNAAGNTTTSTFDPAGELTAQAYSNPATPNVAFTYDADGRRATMTDGTGTTSYTYDALGRLTSSTNAAGATVGYTWTAAGDLTALTYPGSGNVTYTYDAAGRPSGLTDWAGHHFSFNVDADGSLSAQVGPDTTTTLSRNADEALTALTVKNGNQPLAAFLYSRDADNRVVANLDLTTSGLNVAIDSYTPDSQLASVNLAPYSYNKSGDPTQLAGSINQNFTATELTSQTSPAATTNFTYNPQGDRTTATTTTRSANDGRVVVAKPVGSPKTTTYAYDQLGRLLSITNPGAATPNATYTYDGTGMRASSTTAGTTARYTWDLLGPTPLLLSDSTNNYVYSPWGTALEQIPTASAAHPPVLFLHQDQLGSTRLITDQTGKVLATPTYSAYGQPTSAGNAITPIGYAGGYTDPSGLIYLQHRYYDPTTAQYLTPDGGLPVAGAYTYTNDDPLNLVDPSGRTACIPDLNVATGGGIGNTLGDAVNAASAAISEAAAASAAAAAGTAINNAAIVNSAITAVDNAVNQANAASAAAAVAAAVSNASNVTNAISAAAAAISGAAAANAAAAAGTAINNTVNDANAASAAATVAAAIAAVDNAAAFANAGAAAGNPGGGAIGNALSNLNDAITAAAAAVNQAATAAAAAAAASSADGGGD